MSQEEDHVLVQIDEISQTVRTLVDLWYRVLSDTELLIQILLRRLEEQQQAAGTARAAETTQTQTRTQAKTTFSSRPIPAPESERHESTASVSSRTSLKGIDNLQQLLDEDASSSSGRCSQRTTRSHTVSEQQQSFVAGGSQPQSPQATSPQAVDRRESASVGSEEVQVVACQETSDGTASPPVRTRRRDVKAKTVVRDNIAKLEAAIKQLDEIKRRMCTEIVCNTKGNASYDAAAVEIDETVKKLQSIGLAP